MSCSLTKGRLKGCRGGIAGVKAIYLANHDPAITFTETSNELTDTGSALTIYRYDLVRSTGGYTEEINVSQENNSVFYEQTVNISLFDIDKNDRAEFLLIAKANVFCFVEDFNGDIFLIGRTAGAMISAGQHTLGQTAGDKVGIDLTFTAQEPEHADFCENAGATPFVNWTNITVTAGT